MSDTSTTEATVTVARGELVLATVSEGFRDWPGGTPPEDRTFYVTRSQFSDEYVTLVVPESDPRHAGMWLLYDGHGLTLNGDHYGWNTPRQYVRPYDTPTPPETPAPVARPFAVGDRVRISATHPAGPNWQGHTGTIRSLGDHHEVLMDSGPHTGSIAGFHEEYLMHVDDAPTGESSATGEALVADALTSPRFSQEDVDRLVREAREDAKWEASQALEEFKETANARAVEYAEQNGLCSEFERCMEDIGLLGREEWHDSYDKEYCVRFTVDVVVRARDFDDAYEKALEELHDELPSGMDDTIAYVSTDVL